MSDGRCICCRVNAGDFTGGLCYGCYMMHDDLRPPGDVNSRERPGRPTVKHIDRECHKMRGAMGELCRLFSDQAHHHPTLESLNEVVRKAQKAQSIAIRIQRAAAKAAELWPKAEPLGGGS